MDVTDKEKSWPQYLKEKRMKVLSTIIPVLKPFGITKVDYEVNLETYQETLVIDDTKIGCTCNSLEAILQEVVGYLFIKTWVPPRILVSDPYVDHCVEVITRYWIKEG